MVKKGLWNDFWYKKVYTKQHCIKGPRFYRLEFNKQKLINVVFGTLAIIFFLLGILVKIIT